MTLRHAQSSTSLHVLNRVKHWLLFEYLAKCSIEGVVMDRFAEECYDL